MSALYQHKGKLPSFVKLKRRERVQSSRSYGLRGGWDEYQVWRGRKIVFRAETYEVAKKWCADNSCTIIY